MTAGEREAFEKALGVLHPSWTFDDDGTGGYHNPRTEAAWQGWQASREAHPVAPYAETADYKRGWSDGCIWAKEQFSLEPVAPDPNSLQGNHGSCAECGKTSTRDSMWALYCVDCSVAFAAPLAVEPWAQVVASLCPAGIEQACDECGGEPAKCIEGCPYPIARKLLAAVPTHAPSGEANSLGNPTERSGEAMLRPVPTAQQLRSKAVRDGINVLLANCTAQQRAGLHRIHDAAPWKGLANCPEDRLDETYGLVRRTVLAEALQSNDPKKAPENPGIDLQLTEKKL